MESFFDKKIFEKIKEFIHEAGKILLLAHLDADGLSSAGIIGKLLMSYGKTFTVKVLKQLEDDKVLRESSDDLIIIADMGSGQLSIVKDYVGRKKFIIIDHHQIQDNFEHENLIHFNPGIYDDSYSASGLCYLVAKELNPSFEKLVYLGLVGAVGDAQYQENFKGFNQEMLEFGLEKNYLGMSRGLNLFGRVSKPLHETLANSFELTIPGVTGNESGAIELLSELNIDLKNKDSSWKTLAGLDDSERKKLITNILIRRANKGLNDDVLRNIISISGKKGLLSDLNEWSVLLNACGR